MRSTLIARAGQGVLTLVVTLVLVFLILRLAPSDPATVLLSDSATPEQIQQVRHLWGLDKPIPVQFVLYIGNLLRGDAGNSFQFQQVGGTGTPAFGLVTSRMPYTVELALAALVLAILIAIPLGMLTATKPDSLLDHGVFSVSLLLHSLPNFWIGLLLIQVVSVRFGLLPSGGTGTLKHLILPAITLSLPFSVFLMRLTRTEMARVLRSEYIVTARAKGITGQMVLWRHALRNVLIPLVTVIGLRLGSLLNGAVVVETLFRWPGIGSLMVSAIGSRDYPIVQVIVPLSAAVFVAINFAVDVIYSLVDPRIRARS